MSKTNESTSLLCLFHQEDHASAALNDLQQAGVPQSSITSISGAGANAQLSSFGMPDSDRKLLENNLRDGAILLAVEAAPQQVSLVERIFGDHSAKLVDEFDRAGQTAAVAAPLAAAAAPLEGRNAETLDEGRAIPIVEEELAVGKRTVDQGGVRVFRRVVEIPVQESVNLREEHVVIDRQAVNRPATQADLDNSGRSIELTETAEEAVVGKTARVVEEVLVGKKTGEHVEHIQDTVRRTEIEVEELPSQSAPNTPSRLK